MKTRQEEKIVNPRTEEKLPHEPCKSAAIPENSEHHRNNHKIDPSLSQVKKPKVERREEQEKTPLKNIKIIEMEEPPKEEHKNIPLTEMSPVEPPPRELSKRIEINKLRNSGEIKMLYANQEEEQQQQFDTKIKSFKLTKV